MRVTVTEYDPRWPGQFARLREVLLAALRGVDVLAVEHVGSTAVPGLRAKPVIDVDVVVARRSLAGALEALESVGYAYVGEQGVTDRHALRAPRRRRPPPRLRVPRGVRRPAQPPARPGRAAPGRRAARRVRARQGGPRAS